MFPLPGGVRSFPAALRDAADPKAAVRVAGLRDLRHYAAEQDDDQGRRKQILAALERALGDDSEPSVRAAAALTLADIKASEAVEALLEAAADGDPEVRQMAVTALGEIGDERATSQVAEALGDEQPAVRFQAVIAFPRVCRERERAVQSLLAALDDEDPLICHIALRMAEELGTADDPDGVDERIVARAAQLLDHASDTVVVASAIILARTGSDSGHDVLVALANGHLSTREAEDEATAIELCGELGLRGAIPGLETRAFPPLLRLGQEPFAWQARVALAALGHERASQWILEDLSSWSRARRTLAAAAAGRARLAAAREPLLALRGRPRRADPQAVEEALALLDKRDEQVG